MSEKRMLLLSRALQLVELPFFGFLLDCRVTVAQCTILGLLYFRMQGSPQPDALLWRIRHIFISTL